MAIVWPAVLVAEWVKSLAVVPVPKVAVTACAPPEKYTEITPLDELTPPVPALQRMFLKVCACMGVPPADAEIHDTVAN
jgi:hypothetical protein